MLKKVSYLNSNGLEDGRIPAGNPCPFLKKCHPTFQCPGELGVYQVPYSCGLARAFSLEAAREAPEG